MLWDWDGTLKRIHHALAVRERKGDEAGPTADIQNRDGARLMLDKCTHA
jgi:hypothetical protein